MEDSTVLSRLSAQAALRQRSGIRDLIDNPTGLPPGESRPEAGTLPPMEDMTPLPQAGDTYEACARVANQMVPTLYLILGNGDVRSFPNSARVEGPDLVAADSPGGGLMIVLRFAGITGTEVRIVGRNLDRLHVLLGDQRIRWVRELPKGRDFKAEGVPVITGISVMRVEG